MLGLLRGASLALGTDELTLGSARLALAATLTLQAVVMGAYLIVREPRQLQRVVQLAGCYLGRSDRYDQLYLLVYSYGAGERGAGSGDGSD